MAVKKYNIPAGFPWNAAVKLQRKTQGTEEYVDVTDPTTIGGGEWSLHFVDDARVSRKRIPLDWSSMSPQGYVMISLSSDDTRDLTAQRLHLEVRNDDMISDIMTLPDTMFYFVPNKIV